jgi:pyruvate-ferredoxin/flavodoxin oxidoreductase
VTDNAPEIYGGRYGLGSKDTNPSHIAAVFNNLKKERPKKYFTIGINDDVTKTSLQPIKEIKAEPEDMISCQVWGLGSDGTVGANKQAIKIIGEHSDLKVQAYFDYDSKKSGGLTVSHLRFGKDPIRSTYLVSHADYVACHNQSYVNKYDLLQSIKHGGVFVLNTAWEGEELEKNLPNIMKKQLADKDAQFYTINAIGIAQEIGLGNRINMIMQGAFFKLTNVLPEEVYVTELKAGINKMYGKKGEKIVKMNQEAVDRGIKSIHKVKIPKEWSKLESDQKASVEEPKFIREIMRPMSEMKGGDLPVSAFTGIEDGTFPSGITAYEKRGIAANVPEWIEERCIQ